jgi:hypothetical protein
MTTTENLIERDLISKLEDLKCTYRPDIRDRAALASLETGKAFQGCITKIGRVRSAFHQGQELVLQ